MHMDAGTGFLKAALLLAFLAPRACGACNPAAPAVLKSPRGGSATTERLPPRCTRCHAYTCSCRPESAHERSLGAVVDREAGVRQRETSPLGPQRTCTAGDYCLRSTLPVEQRQPHPPRSYHNGVTRPTLSLERSSKPQPQASYLARCRNRAGTPKGWAWSPRSVTDEHVNLVGRKKWSVGLQRQSVERDRPTPRLRAHHRKSLGRVNSSFRAFQKEHTPSRCVVQSPITMRGLSHSTTSRNVPPTDQIVKTRKKLCISEQENSSNAQPTGIAPRTSNLQNTFEPTAVIGSTGSLDRGAKENKQALCASVCQKQSRVSGLRFLTPPLRRSRNCAHLAGDPAEAREQSQMITGQKACQ